MLTITADTADASRWLLNVLGKLSDDGLRGMLSEIGEDLAIRGQAKQFDQFLHEVLRVIWHVHGGLLLCLGMIFGWHSRGQRGPQWRVDGWKVRQGHVQHIERFALVAD